MFDLFFSPRSILFISRIFVFVMYSISLRELFQSTNGCDRPTASWDSPTHTEHYAFTLSLQCISICLDSVIPRQASDRMTWYGKSVLFYDTLMFVRIMTM